MIKKYNLYSSEGCHLCEDALTLCNGVIAIDNINVIDIVEDEKLVELYGICIPVLEHIDSDKKLFWPFTKENIKELT